MLPDRKKKTKHKKVLWFLQSVTWRHFLDLSTGKEKPGRYRVQILCWEYRNLRYLEFAKWYQQKESNEVWGKGSSNLKGLDYCCMPNWECVGPESTRPDTEIYGSYMVSSSEFLWDQELFVCLSAVVVRGCKEKN